MTIVQDDLFGREFLDGIIDWISDNMEPGEVYEEVTLCTWVRDYTGPDPTGVYSDSELEKWARDNGFVKESEINVSN